MKPALPALCALFLLPAQAVAAPTLAPLKPCYVSAYSEEQWSSEPISLTGSGFTPAAPITLYLDGNVAGRTTAASDGTIVGALNAPFQRAGERDFAVSAGEAGQPAVTVTSRVTALSVTVKPKRARAGQTVTFSGRGFTAPDEHVYLHHVLRDRNRRTVKLARPAGPCGTFTVRRRQFPMARPASGMWTFRFEQVPAFQLRPEKPFFTIDVLVQRRPIRG